MTIRVIELGQDEIASFPDDRFQASTSAVGEVKIGWSYTGGRGNLAECATEQELIDGVADEQKAPQLAEILVFVEAEGQVHEVRIPVTETLLPEFSPVKVNRIDLGEVVLDEFDGCD